MNIVQLMRGLSLIDIDVLYLLSLACLLMKSMHDKFPTSYRLPILHKKPINHIALLVLVSCTTTATELPGLFGSCLAAVGGLVKKLCDAVSVYVCVGVGLGELGVVVGVEVCFGIIKIEVWFLIRWNLKVFWPPVCLCVVSLLSILHCLIS